MHFRVEGEDSLKLVACQAFQEFCQCSRDFLRFKLSVRFQNFGWFLQADDQFCGEAKVLQSISLLILLLSLRNLVALC